MMNGKRKTLVDASTSCYGVFPMTGGSTWCGEWTAQRHQERELLLRDEIKRDQAYQEFAKRHPGSLVRVIP